MSPSLPSQGRRSQRVRSRSHTHTSDTQQFQQALGGHARDRMIGYTFGQILQKRLPAELREMIYRELWSEYNLEESLSVYHRYDFTLAIPQVPRMCQWMLCTSTVGQKVAAEVNNVFYRDVTIWFAFPMLPACLSHNAFGHCMSDIIQHLHLGIYPFLNEPRLKNAENMERFRDDFELLLQFKSLKTLKLEIEVHKFHRYKAFREWHWISPTLLALAREKRVKISIFDAQLIHGLHLPMDEPNRDGPRYDWTPLIETRLIERMSDGEEKSTLAELSRRMEEHYLQVKELKQLQEVGALEEEEMQDMLDGLDAQWAQEIQEARKKDGAV